MEEADGNKNNEKPPRGIYKNMNDYMENVTTKRNQQLIKNLEETKIVSNIFSGVRIFVNGYTDPCASSLHTIIAENGGKYSVHRFQGYTHMIASNLCKASLKSLLKTKIVHPNWIIDSVKHGLLLPWYNYITGDSQNNRRIKEFYSPKIVQLSIDNSIDDSANRYYDIIELDDLGTNNIFSQFHEAYLFQPPELYDTIFQHCKDKYVSNLPYNFVKYYGCISLDLISCVDISYKYTSPYNPVAICSDELDFYHPNFGPYIIMCNFHAYNSGVRRGYTTEAALKVCKNLILIDYDDTKITTTAISILNSLFKYFPVIEPITIDQFIIDLSFHYDEKTLLIISEEILICLKSFSCDTKLGIGNSADIAVLASNNTLPNTIKFIDADSLKSSLDEYPTSKVPSLSYITNELLQCENIDFLVQLKYESIELLQNKYGKRDGRKLYNYIHGLSISNFGDSFNKEKPFRIIINPNISSTKLNEFTVTFNNICCALYLYLIYKRIFPQHMKTKIIVFTGEKDAKESNYPSDSCIKKYSTSISVALDDHFFLNFSSIILNTIRSKLCEHFKTVLTITLHTINLLPLDKTKIEKILKTTAFRNIWAGPNTPTGVRQNVELKHSEPLVGKKIKLNIAKSNKKLIKNKIRNNKGKVPKTSSNFTLTQLLNSKNMPNTSNSCSIPSSNILPIHAWKDYLFDLNYDLFSLDTNIIIDILIEGCNEGYLDIVYQKLSHLDRLSTSSKALDTKVIKNKLNEYFMLNYDYPLLDNKQLF